MSDRPIIFSAQMVRALIDGRKTQTRRVLKPWPGRHTRWLTMELLHSAPSCYTCESNGHYGVQMQHPLAGTTQPYGKVDDLSPLTWVRLPYAPGDRLWVKETWATDRAMDSYSPSQMAQNCVDAGYEKPWAPVLYFADDAVRNRINGGVFGRTRSPIHMPRWASRITLTVTDVRVRRVQDISEADAFAEGCEWSGDRNFLETPSECYRDLWNSLHGQDAWKANPWVCALTFTVHYQNIDRLKNGDAT